MNILFIDIDHTLSHAHWRDGMISTDINWDEYHQMSHDDKPVSEMVALVKACFHNGWRIVALTSRPNKWKPLTLTWLIKHNIPIHDLLMRADFDFRSTPESKVAGYQEYIKQLEETPGNIIIIDDHDGVATAFKEIKVTLLQAHVRRNP